MADRLEIQKGFRDKVSAGSEGSGENGGMLQAFDCGSYWEASRPF